MKYKSILTRMAEDEEKHSPSRNAIPPPSSHKQKELKFPKPPSTPNVKTELSEEELAKLEEKMFIYERDQPILDMLRQNEKYYNALDEMDQYIEEYENARKSTDLMEPPKEANKKLDKLLKLCNYFYELTTK